MAEAPESLSSALEALIVRYAAMLRQVGERHGLTNELVDEVIQEVRISLWRARPAASQLAAIGPGYVHRAAVSAALTVLRRRRAKRESASALSPEIEQVAADPKTNPQESLEQAELHAQLRAAVAALDLPRQTVVRLHLHGYQRDEIAKLLGWSEAKTRNLLYRGLADLRQILTERGITAEHVA
ncbi:MAG TPA: sigma-70 family RNA polymerase sigma factor [Gemmatimonadaceae bacterium]|nr:sigma-70 family RNA polymerase sigma factor [Gemmatimonadaceae bacterium]